MIIITNHNILYITRNILVNQLSLFILFQNKFDINSLYDFYKDSYGKECELSQENGFYLSSYFDTIDYISSYMIALKLYNKTLQDKYEGFNTYKTFMMNPSTSLSTLLDTYNLNFINNNETYELVKLKSEIAYKKLIK